MKRAFILLAAGLLVASAHASYAQMRLDGAGLFLALVLAVGYGVLVDGVLLASIFRYPWALVIGSIFTLIVVGLLLGAVASPSERAEFFGGRGSGFVVLVVTSAVFLPFIVIAPFAQYLALRGGRRSPGWILAWMALQLALIPLFIVLGITDERYRQKESAAGQSEGRQVTAGGLNGLLERAEQQRERIWGTPWRYPWLQKPPAQLSTEPSGWILGLATGMDASALVAANEPLGAEDRAALQKLMERHFRLYAVPHIRAKVLLEKLEPRRFSKHLTHNLVSAEAIPVLLERLENYDGGRLCPGGRMMDADRSALNALLLAQGGGTLRPPLDSYKQRVDRVCLGQG